MKRKLLIALLCAAALCWLCGAALGESKTEYGQQIGASLDALQTALASQDKSAADSALRQVRSSVYSGVRYLAQIGEYDDRAMEILVNTNAAYQAVFGGDGNYASYMSQAREYNTQVFFTEGQDPGSDPETGEPFAGHVHRSSELEIIEPATCVSEGLASGICDAGVNWYGVRESQDIYHGYQKPAPCGAYFTWETEIDPNNHAGGTSVQGQNIVCLGCGAVLSYYTVSISTSIANGTIALSGESTQFVENATVILTVNPAQGYELDSLTYTPAGGTAVVITPGANGVYSFTMPAANVTVNATFRKAVYAITTDGAARAYYYSDTSEQVFPTEAAEGTELRLTLDDSAEPEEGNYFTGEFWYVATGTGDDPVLLGSVSENGWTNPVESFIMPAYDVTIGAAQAEREALTLAFAADETRALPIDAWMQLQFYETAEGASSLILYDEATGTEALDVNLDGQPDLQIAFDDDACCVNLTRLPGCAASGVFTLAFSGPTDRFGTIAFALFGPAGFTLPAAPTTIEESAFEGMTALAVVDASGVASIGPNAFRDCTRLTQIRLGANCAVHPTAFTGCGTVYVFAPANSDAQSSCAGIENVVFIAE